MANSYSLDFTGIQSSNYIPEGIHTVRVSSSEFTKAKTGSDQLMVTFETADGAIRSQWYNLQQQALWKLKGFLEVLGIACDGRINLTTGMLKGKTCQITVEPDPNDDTKLIVSKVSKVDNNSAPAVNYQAAPPVSPIPTQPTPVPQQPVTPQVAPQPETPAPVQQASQPVQNNLPPWMTNSAPAGNSAPQGNLPPWMRK